ncbi:hypothetical protein AV530_019778 [Patagioenas fasciata monilis]|uniref:Uncharacterized protein n=1 Tax=Patagioenas fasciata monilis TaxID=372326 RepID=A0A1V4JZB9_PATFA|nr:hypothetical protein AV530_019778 [Patagioenas fasciata monilis]
MGQAEYVPYGHYFQVIIFLWKTEEHLDRNAQSRGFGTSEVMWRCKVRAADITEYPEEEEEEQQEKRSFSSAVIIQVVFSFPTNGKMSCECRLEIPGYLTAIFEELLCARVEGLFTWLSPGYSPERTARPAAVQPPAVPEPDLRRYLELSCAGKAPPVFSMTWRAWLETLCRDVEFVGAMLLDVSQPWLPLALSGVFFVFQLTPRATPSLKEFVQGQKGQSHLLRVFLGHVEQQQRGKERLVVPGRGSAVTGCFPGTRCGNLEAHPPSLAEQRTLLCLKRLVFVTLGGKDR